MNWEADGFRPDCPFKTLFQNRVQRQPPCEIAGVPFPFHEGHPYRTILYKSCGDPNLAAAGASNSDVRDEAAKAREALAGMMTPAQVAEAQKRASAWQPK